MKKAGKRIAIALVALLVVVAIVFGVYVGDYERASQPALEAMVSSDTVRVEEDQDYIVYSPTGETHAGLIFYPGGKVEPTVYSRIFGALAEQGVETVVVKMPFNLAMFKINGAEDVLEDFDGIDTWYMGGHSLGGVFATEYLKDHADAFDGMIYMASYPNSDISDIDMPIISLKGSLDTVINSEAYETGKALLPEDTHYYVIEGGNHTNFGDYPLQEGDTASTISADEQHQVVVEAIMSLIQP